MEADSNTMRKRGFSKDFLQTKKAGMGALASPPFYFSFYGEISRQGIEVLQDFLKPLIGQPPLLISWENGKSQKPQLCKVSPKGQI